MKRSSMFLLGTAGLCAAGAASAAACGAGAEPRVTLHPRDSQDLAGSAVGRTWRGAGHLLHHLRELLALLGPLSAVYLARAIDPAFRERIMLVTAMANECSW